MTDVFRHPRLFAVLLGGRAPGCRVELHDVAFAVGRSLEETHPQLLDQWFGQARGLHVDAWCVLDRVAGHRIRLDRKRPAGGPRLHFINIGGYASGEFAEQHAYAFIAAADKAEAKRIAKSRLLPGRDQVHKDDLFEIDDCLAIERVGDWHVVLEADAQARDPSVTNGYFPLPRATIDTWEASGKRRG